MDYSDSEMPDSPVLPDVVVKLAAWSVDQQVDADEMQEEIVPGGIIVREDADGSEDDDDSYTVIHRNDVPDTDSLGDFNLDSDSNSGMARSVVLDPDSASEAETEPIGRGSPSGHPIDSPDGDNDAESASYPDDETECDTESLASTIIDTTGSLIDGIRDLGFATVDQFLDFTHRPEIRGIFQELWDDWLHALPSDTGLPVGVDSDEVCALIGRGIERCWRNEAAAYRYEEERPDKTGWAPYDHLMRFTMKLGPLCDEGQPLCLRDNPEGEFWAGCALELVRVLRSMQKGFPDRSLYLRSVRGQREDER